jgi:tripartite ATP-independent transporter DctM subunit
MSDALLFCLIYFLALVIFGATGFYVAVVMMIITGVSVLWFYGPAMVYPMADLAWSTSNNYVLISMPLFILLGELLMRSGITERMYHTMSMWMTRIPGRLLHTNIAACALFAATSGSSVATAATIGTVAVPALKSRGYDDRLCLGSLAAGGTLGILIPPSLNLIIYGVMTDTSIGRLFIAGVIPGVLLSALFMSIIGAFALLRPEVAPFNPADVKPLRERIAALPAIIPPLLVVLGVTGSIYLGVATPTEAAAVGVLVALGLAFWFRRVSTRMLSETFLSTMRTTGMVMLIILAAFLMNFVIALLGIPQDIASWVKSLGLDAIAVLWILLIIYLALGCFLEGLSMMITTIPITAPLVFSLGVDPVWFGIFIVLVTELALITPPVGINLYVVQGIRTDGGSFSDVIMGAIPFVITLMLFTILMIYFPQISLWLPGQMMGT